MANRVIYPFKIKAKADRMNANVSDLEENLSRTKEIFLELTESSQNLSGKAWESCFSFVNELHLPANLLFALWCYEEKKANSIYKSEADRLPQVQELNENDMLYAIDMYNDFIDDELDEEYPSYSSIRYWRRQIKNLEKKLRAMDRFEANTTGIYDAAISTASTLKQLNAAISSINVNNITAQSNNLIPFTLKEEVRILQEKSVAIALLLNAGVSHDEIYAVESIGYSLSDYAILCGLNKGKGKNINYNALINNFAYALLQHTGAVTAPSTFGGKLKNFMTIPDMPNDIEKQMQNYYDELSSKPWAFGSQEENKLILLNRYFEFKTNSKLGIYDESYDFAALSRLIELDNIKAGEISAMANLFEKIAAAKDESSTKNVEKFISACYPESKAGFDDSSKKYLLKTGTNYGKLINCLNNRNITDNIKSKYLMLLKRLNAKSDGFEYYPVLDSSYKPQLGNTITWTDDDYIKMDVFAIGADLPKTPIYAGLSGSIQNGNFVTLSDGNIQYYGGDQGWFSGYAAPYNNISPGGCGLIAAGNIFLYMADRNPAYANSITNISANKTKNDYINYIKTLNDNYLSPNPILGLDGFSLAAGVNRYFKKNNIGLKAHWSMSDDFLPEIKQMLDNDIPVILGIGFDSSFREETIAINNIGFGSLTKKIQNINAHYVTITDITEKDTGKVIFTVSSWGAKFELDYDVLCEYKDSKPIGNILTNILIID